MEAKHAFEKYAATFGIKIQKYHANNGAFKTGRIALVLNIKTGYISPQLHIVFDDDFTKIYARITNKLLDNWDDLFNNHRELPPEEFQFSIGKKMKNPTDRSEGDRKVNNNSPSDRSVGDRKVNNYSPNDRSEGDHKVNNNSPSDYTEGENSRSIETNLSPQREQVRAIN